MNADSDPPGLFGNLRLLPEGFRYETDFITETEEEELVRQLALLPFKEFEFQGYLGKRRVVSFGWQSVFDGSGLRKAEDMPASCCRSGTEPPPSRESRRPIFSTSFSRNIGPAPA